MADPTNAEIALALDELGDLYELDGAIIHRVVAYRNAAKAVREASMSVAGLAREGRATELPGVGKTLQEKVQSLVETGSIPAAEKLRAKFPAGLLAITRLPGLGPKRARLLYDELGHRLAGGAARAPRRASGCVASRASGRRRRPTSSRAWPPWRRATWPRSGPCSHAALAVAEPLLAALRDNPAADRVELAGSARRWTDSVKDLDLIATAHDPEALAHAAASLPTVAAASGVGSAGARLTTYTGMKVDLRIVAPEQFGNLLQHFTGSKQHNEALRRAAVRRGLHVSEYGVLDDADGETPQVRQRGGRLRAARPRLHRARAAREPRRAGGRGQRQRCRSSSS